MVGEGGVSGGGSSCLGTTRGSDLWHDGDDAWKGWKRIFHDPRHQHQKAECAETYFGLSGEGILLLESPDGDVEVREIRAGIMVYVPPYWIHRSVNTGNTDLVFLFNYPSDAGQDYGIIERNRECGKGW